ncbi:MAG TPA: tetratricopeptide repeat protein [Caulobacteraceae bacterium]|nr:tetratricopeptide repeat protein [Caulobacteraceae bacterium]
MSQPNPSPTPEAIVALALERHRAGLRHEAEALYRQALAADPGDPTALYLYGLLNFELGRSDEAAEFLETVVALRPDHAQARLTLAQLRHWRGEHAAAVTAYRQALALAPDRANAAIGLANALREAGLAAQAIAEGEAAAAAFPRLAEAWMALAAARFASGDAQSAASAYAAAIALDPDRLAARAGLTNALLAAGQAAAAEAAAEVALAIDPASAELWFLRGASLRALFRTDEAIAALERAVALDPSRPAAHLDLGVLYAERGRAGPAEACLQRALMLDPALAEAHATLGSIYLRAGREGPAEQHSRAALALDPTLVAPHQTLASLLAAQGWATDAKRHRDTAYGGRNLFIEPAPGLGFTVLMPITSEAGNTPLRDLMPRARISRLRWVIEYATDEQMAALPPYDVVFNAIGDVDLAGPTSAPMRRFLGRCERSVLNPPAKIARTRRDRIAQLLAGLPNVAVPKARRLSEQVIRRHGLAGAVARAGLRAPLLLRPVGAHGGRGLTRIETIDELGGSPPAGDLYATAYHDYRSPDGFYRKYRVIYVDRQAFPYHLAISPEWLVHYESAGMDADAWRRAEEERFLYAPAEAIGPAAMTAIEAIGQRLDLDYAGIDFAVLEDGRLLVFEANATMLAHADEPDGPFAYKGPAVAEIVTDFGHMLAAAAAKP